jgi:hypothetical protein
MTPDPSLEATLHGSHELARQFFRAPLLSQLLPDPLWIPFLQQELERDSHHSLDKPLIGNHRRW